jgi:hypothetical protein
MVGGRKGGLVGTHIVAVVFVAARHTRQRQDVNAEYECKKLHGAKIGKFFYSLFFFFFAGRMVWLF